ncbi:MAG: transposase [Planctomycetes bacterium]|nr:transposase [Planctomycetota bacterium]
MARILDLVRLHPRFGYRRVRARLVAEGWRVSRKRVHRLWRANGPGLPRCGRLSLSWAVRTI